MARLGYHYALYEDHPREGAPVGYDWLDFSEFDPPSFVDGAITPFQASLVQNIDEIADVGFMGGGVRGSLVGAYNDAAHTIWWNHFRPLRPGQVFDQTSFSGTTVNRSDGYVAAMSGTFHHLVTRLLEPGEPDPDGQGMETTDVYSGVWAAALASSFYDIPYDPLQAQALLQRLEEEGHLYPHFAPGGG